MKEILKFASSWKVLFRDVKSSNNDYKISSDNEFKSYRCVYRHNVNDGVGVVTIDKKKFENNIHDDGRKHGSDEIGDNSRHFFLSMERLLCKLISWHG